ncbi:relaxase/mobilization nuclease domain-containing protein [Streptomyces silvisoli]|uniref:Mobilization protein n=1 Tax=Streptomyces silvisoli TaxID=3034235 RepID=A0ABT5ZPZ5_9ACTN|nr:mobilization protein [Streptomyces silvisoli]MDF3291903.1 mobilization protein [Streptomyces silvisoli]
MVPNVTRGSRTHGLLAYLYGPGRHEEHTDPHLVASWDGFAPDPGRDPDATLTQLTRALDLRVIQVGDRGPAKHVWHCSVRTDPGDRHLTDAEWGEVARRIVNATGIAPTDDPDGCRWVAVRHAHDHIHIAATIVRGNLRQPRIAYDFNRAQDECRRVEKEWNLRELNPGDGTAAKNPTNAEHFKAERTGQDQTARETLREAVRQALAGASTEVEFFERLTAAGLRVDKRHVPSGDVLGYKVALPGDRNRNGDPIWFPGSKLAPDLSLPKIRQRLTNPAATNEADGDPQVPTVTTVTVRPSRPAQARRDAVKAAEQAMSAFDEDHAQEAAAQLVGIGEVLDAIAQTAPAASRPELRAAARAFERATRSHIRAEQADNHALRAAARGIVHAGGALGRGEDGGATAMLLSTLVLVAVAAARWHSARGHAQQAAASREAAEHLRAGYQAAAQAPMNAMREQGRSLPETTRERHLITVRAALPEGADHASSSPGWDALAATLDQAEQAGYDPEALLKEAVEMRELDTADNVNDVLVWRLRRLGDLPTQPTAPRSSDKKAANRQNKSQSGRNAARMNPTTAAQPTPAQSHARPTRH